MTAHKLKLDLGVNIDHVATLRNARGTTYPDPIHAAVLAEQYGVDLITLHLREDRRHIVDEDLFRLRPLIRTRMNLECALTPEMIEIACQVKPHDVCLVPEKREEVTTEGGLDVLSYEVEIEKAVKRLQEHQITVSIFIDPDLLQIDAAKRTGATVIELHTGAYANADHVAAQEELLRLIKAAHHAASIGLKVNAGHGLTEDNVAPIAKILEISELNIGHAIVSQAIFKGWERAIADMKQIMQKARQEVIHTSAS